MSKIRSAFENGKAFIPFITCGDPNLETTAKIVREAVANGADLIAVSYTHLTLPTTSRG